MTLTCSSWKTGSEKIACVLASPDGAHVLSASQSIKLWDAATRKLLKTFTGHASPVLSLTFVPKPASNGEYYFLSTAKGDRYINVWWVFFLVIICALLDQKYLFILWLVVLGPLEKMRKVQLLAWCWRVTPLVQFHCVKSKIMELSALQHSPKVVLYKCFLISLMGKI